MQVDLFPDRTVNYNGKLCLYFGGTSYLGLSTNKDFLKVLTGSIQKWGSFYGSSRQSNIQLSIFDEVETFIARQIGSKAALTTSSGTLAGRLVLNYLEQANTTFYHYPKTHPAIIGAKSTSLFVNNELHESLKTPKKEQIVITVDAILALDVTPISFDFLNDIADSKEITLVVDESHSLGILGKEGQGIFNGIPTKNLKRKILVASMGKALGIQGGIIASDWQFINDLKSETMFVSSSCANAAYLETYLKGQNIINKQREKLQENLQYFTDRFQPNSPFKFDRNYPVIYSSKKDIYDTLLNNGIIISNFKYPNYEGVMNRIVITANHTRKDLKQLITILNSF